MLVVISNRIDEGHIYFLDQPISLEEAKLSERAYYKKIIRLKLL